MSCRIPLGLLLMTFLLSGCAGVFKYSEWELYRNYCPGNALDHFKEGDKIKLRSLFGKEAMRLRNSIIDVDLEITSIELNSRVLWAEAKFKTAAVTLDHPPGHTECVKLQRADEQLGHTGVEVFIFSKPLGPETCQSLINANFMSKVRLGNCDHSHQGGWAGRR